jgi:mRNA-degrading endonuclease toxin of MazEF toxin-antitoxin module
MVVAATTTIRKIPQEVRVGRREGLMQDSVVNLDNTHAVPKVCLGELIGTLAPARRREVKRALGYALDWAEVKLL